MSPKYVVVHNEDWTALYVDGELEMYTDSYLVDEYFQNVLGVDVRFAEDYDGFEDANGDAPKRLEDLKEEA